MSERFDDGGSAFAADEVDVNAGHYEGRYEIIKQHLGMTLLDYFAGQIAADDSNSWGVDHDGFAKYCYERAAAMVRRKRELERGEQ